MKAEIAMGDVAKRLTLTVKINGAGIFKVRCWLGRQILKLAAAVIGCGIEVSVGDPELDEARGVYTLANTVEAGKYVRVYLNDVEQQSVVFADVRKGMVRKHVLPLHAIDGELAMETLRGAVRVEPIQ